MNASPNPEPASPAKSKKRLLALSRRQWILIGGGVLVLAVGGWSWSTRSVKAGTNWGAAAAAPLSAAVSTGPFLQEVIERGEVESSSNVEIRCEVQSRLAAGTPIIQIVAEGTYVKTGDFLVKLDDSGLQADLVQQQIAANSSRALVVEADADYEAAKLALEEYEEGTFRQEQGAMESDEFVAKENVRRAEEYLRFSERLAGRGYVTEVQLEADRFAVEKARKDLDSAATKLEVLRKFTKLKTMNRLKAGVETSEARLRARENSHNLDEDRRKTLEDQLAKCVIKAPTSGQVVYANLPTGDPLIAEGKMVRERQIIVRLPDPRRMQVIARVNESRIDRVKVGMHARIKLDAFTDTELSGTVRSVSEYPLPAASAYSTMKEYAAEVDIDDPPAGVRSGMTAQVSVEVQRLENVVQVPVQTVLERGDRYFCLIIRAGALAAREVTVGPANDQSVVIEDGLHAGDLVVLAPQSHETKVSLPAAPQKAKGSQTTGKKFAKATKKAAQTASAQP